MIIEFIKMLLEEPSKLKKLIIIIARILLSIILASWFYSKIISPYTVFDIFNFKNWADFITTGRILIVGFMYLFSYFLLFYLLESILGPLTIYLLKPKPVKHIDKMGGRTMARFLRIYHLLDIDYKEKKIRLMENSDTLYQITTLLINEEAKKEIKSFQHSLINEIFFTYAAFLIIYFSILTTQPHPTGLTILLLVCLVLFLLLYGAIGSFLELMYKASPDLIIAVDIARIEESMENSLRESGIFLRIPENGNHKYKLFYYEGKEFAIVLVADKRKINKHRIEDSLRFSAEQNKKVWIVTNRPIDNDAKQLIDEHPNNIMVTSFDQREELANKIKAAIISLKQTD